MDKTQKFRNIFDKLFRVKTAIILWIAHAILYGLCLVFCYIHNSHILMDVFGGASGIVNIVAYVSSAGAIIRTFINRDLVVKRKILAVVLIVGGIQRRRENKLLGKRHKNEDVLGTVGRAMGASVFRGLPTDITGMHPSGHFQKPDFSFDEEAEEEYTEKYEK